MSKEQALRILFLHPQPCIRMYKEAKGLKNRGFNIILAHQGTDLNAKYGYGNELFSEIIKLPVRSYYFPIDYMNIKKYRVIESIVKDNHIDLIHSHNAGDLLTVAAKRFTDIPVIHDTHDMVTLYCRMTFLLSFIRNYLRKMGRYIWFMKAVLVYAGTGEFFRY